MDLMHGKFRLIELKTEVEALREKIARALELLREGRAQEALALLDSDE